MLGMGANYGCSCAITAINISVAVGTHQLCMRYNILEIDRHEKNSFMVFDNCEITLMN